MQLQIQKVNACQKHVFYLFVFERVVDYLAVTALFDYIGGTEKS